jgi:cytochrome oxidase Cu insertion factor (SCO1/SenC/PrrC family)
VRIAGDRQQQEPAATGTEAEAAGLRAVAAHRTARRRRMWTVLGVVAVLLVGLNAYAAYVLYGENNQNAGANVRPSGIPRNISTGLANMMELSPILSARAPGFTLTDQNGHTMSLASLRGKVVVLEFMDPHCTDICPIVSQEFVDAYHRLGAQAGKVVFAAVNVNQYYATVASMAAYSREHQLNTIPNWHFLTGALPALRTAWRDYDITVEAPDPKADIIHTSAVYFIDPRGRERFVATPMADHSANGTAYLPLAQVSDWGSGIARLAADLAR